MPRSPLAGVPLDDEEHARGLLRALRSSAPLARLREEPVFLAWCAACNVPPAKRFGEWCRSVGSAAAAPTRLPDGRRVELCELAGRVAVEALDFDAVLPAGREADPGAELVPPASAPVDPKTEYAEGLRNLADGFRESWPKTVVQAARSDVLGKGRDKAWFGAQAFVVFIDLPDGTGELSERALAPVVEQLSPRRLLAIEELLDERDVRDWQLWARAPPPRRASARPSHGCCARRGKMSMVTTAGVAGFRAGAGVVGIDLGTTISLARARA